MKLNVLKKVGYRAQVGYGVESLPSEALGFRRRSSRFWAKG